MIDAIWNWLVASTILQGTANWLLVLSVLVAVTHAFVGTRNTPARKGFEKFLQLLAWVVPSDAPGTLKWPWQLVTKDKGAADDTK